MSALSVHESRDSIPHADMFPFETGSQNDGVLKKVLIDLHREFETARVPPRLRPVLARMMAGWRVFSEIWVEGWALRGSESYSETSDPSEQ